MRKFRLRESKGKPMVSTLPNVRNLHVAKSCNLLVILVLLAEVMMLGACSVNDGIQESDNNAVRFTAGIGDLATLQGEPVTKTAGTTWDSGDAIGIFMVGNGGTTTVHAENKQYTTTGGNTFTPATGNEIFYPMDGSKVNFIAYYPYESGATLGTPINVTIGDQNNQSAFDLLYSSGATGSKATASTPVSLTFGHKLAKLVMNTTADASVGVSSLVGMAVKINGMNAQNTLDLKTSTLGTATDNATPIIPRTVTDGTVYDAIIMPGSYAAGMITVEFTTGTETFTWNVGAETFDGGNEYIYAVTLTRTGVKFTGTIKPWTTIDRGTGTAE